MEDRGQYRADTAAVKRGGRGEMCTLEALHECPFRAASLLSFCKIHVDPCTLQVNLFNACMQLIPPNSEFRIRFF